MNFKFKTVDYSPKHYLNGQGQCDVPFSGWYNYVIVANMRKK